MALPRSAPALFLALVATRLLGRPLLDHGLCRGERRNRDAEWRSTDVVHFYFVAELNAGRISSVFAADSNLQLWPNRSPSLNRPANEQSNAMNIQRLKRIIGKDSGFPLVHIFRQEPPGIIPGEPHSHLRQVVCPERKEFCNLGNFVCQ